MFLGVTLLILFSAIAFFGARSYVMSRQSNKEERRKDRVFLIKTFWYCSITMILLAVVALIRVVMNHLGLIPGDLSDFTVSVLWFSAACCFAWEAYSLNERIKKLREK